MEDQGLSEKERVIAEVFYHKRTGFGSLQDTWKQARARDASITRDDVRRFLAKQEIRQRQKPRRNETNSFVPVLARDEFQVDLADFGELANPRYGFTCVDIFTKFAVMLPLRTKSTTETTNALKQVFQQMGYPTSIVCDEGGEFHSEFARLAMEEGVDIVYSRTGGRFVERLIRTLKLDILERKNVYGGSWSQYVDDVVAKYNDSVHSATGFKPSELEKEEYNFPLQHTAHQHMLKRAKFQVKRASIEVGDKVKIRIKQPSFYKETFNSWSKEVYTVDGVDFNEAGRRQYHLNGYRRALLRFELFKVDDVQRPINGQVRSVLQEVQRPRMLPAQAVAALRIARAPPPNFRPVTRSVAAAAASGSGAAPIPAAAARAARALQAEGFASGPLPAPGRNARAYALEPARRPLTRSQTKPA